METMQSVLDAIELSFSHASAVHLMPSISSNDEPAVVVLGFHDVREGEAGYAALQRDFRKQALFLTIIQGEDDLDLSLVVRKSGEAVNIKGLAYDKDQLRDFLANESVEGRLVFAIGYTQLNEGMVVLSPACMPVVIIDGYAIKNRRV